MYTYGIRARGQQALIGATLIIVIEKLDPKQDFAILHRLLEMGCMASDEPPAECGIQRGRSDLKSASEAISHWTCRAGDGLNVAGEHKGAYRLPDFAGLVSKHAT